MQLYFTALAVFSVMCGLMAIVSTPAIISFAFSDMYSQPGARSFSHAALIRLSLGNVRAADEDLEAGRVNALWLASITDCINSIIFLGVILLIQRSLLEVRGRSTSTTLSMSKYSVYVEPSNDLLEWEGGDGKQNEAGFIEKLRAFLQTIGNMQIAEIPNDDPFSNGSDVPAIW